MVTKTTRRLTAKTALGALAGAATILAFASPAAADCESDADCGAGMVCAAYEWVDNCDIPVRPCADDDTACLDEQAAWEQEMADCVPQVQTASYCEVAPCTADADCGPGFVCQTNEWTETCDYPQFSCEEDDPACLEDQAAQEEAMADCEPTVHSESYCSRAPCEVDADCGDTMVCNEETWGTCTGGTAPGVPCGPDEDCPEPEPVDATWECTTETVKRCGYRYEAECTVDADCGEGFLCVESEVCGCSGGGAVEVGPDGVPVDDGVIEEPVCECNPTGDFYCQLQDLACTAHADCPVGMLCEEQVLGGYCYDGPDGSGCVGGETVQRCAPPGGSWSGGTPPYGPGDPEAGDDGTQGVPGEDTGSSSDDDGQGDETEEPEDQACEGHGHHSAGQGHHGQGHHGQGHGDCGTGDDHGGEDDPADEEDDAGSGDEDGNGLGGHGLAGVWPWLGCSFAPSNLAGSPSGLAGLLGLSLLVARRRRR